MKKLLMCVVVAFGIVGCSSNPIQISDKSRSFDSYKEATFEFPDWYMNPPKEDNAIYATATEISSDLQFSIDKSLLSAQREIAFKLSNDVNQKFKEYTTETNYSKDEQTSKQHERLTIANSQGVNLVGVQRVKTSVIREGTKYRSFVLVRYGLDESNKIHMNYMIKERRAKANKELDKFDDELKGNKNVPISNVEPVRADTSVTLLGPQVRDAAVRERAQRVYNDPNAVVIKETVR